jgi:hypothetical protein
VRHRAGTSLLKDRGFSERKWRVSNIQKGKPATLFPAQWTELRISMAAEIFWVVRYHPTEIDDGGSGRGTLTGIDKFVDGEPVENQDVLVWYGAQLRHDVSEQGPGECQEVGP